MELCPTVQYCCNNSGSLWCWACGVDCPSAGPTFASAPLPTFPGRERLLEIDKQWVGGDHHDRHVLEIGRILEKAGDDRTAARLYRRISDVDITSIKDAEQARLVNEALRSRARLLNRQRKALNNKLKQLGG